MLWGLGLRGLRFRGLGPINPKEVDPTPSCPNPRREAHAHESKPGAECNHQDAQLENPHRRLGFWGLGFRLLGFRV